MYRLNEAKTIMKNELRAYFTSPVAYIVISVFLIITGFFFFKDFFYFNQAEMRNLFQFFPLIFTFVVPAVTMRLISEEKQSGSIEILVTLPVKTWDIVLGKFMAALAFVSIMISPTLIYLVTVLAVGSPDFGPIIGGYLGSILLGGAYASIGLLTSSLSRNQIIAVITGWAVCLGLFLFDKITMFLPSWLGFMEYLGSDFHFQNISKGLIDSRDIIYFVSLILISMLLTTRIIEDRR